MTDSDDTPTGKDVHARDWECMDCGVWWAADNDATQFTLPDFCPECGDHSGWVNVKDGREVP